MNATENTGHLDIGGVFSATTEIYKKCFGTVWVVALLLLVPTAIIVALLGNGGLLGIIGLLIQIIASAWLIGSVIRIVQDVEEDGSVDWSVGEILGSVTPKLVSIILLQIVLAILIGFGLILLIIPGVILSLMWVVATPSLVVEDKGVFDSMSRSFELTKGNWLRILWVGIIILLAWWGIVAVGGILVSFVPVLGAIVLIVLGVLIYPYISIIATVLYYRLRDLKDGVAVAVEETVIVEETTDPGQPPAV